MDYYHKGGNPMREIILFGLLFFLFTGCNSTNNNPPKHIYYLHGRIIEMQGKDAYSEDFGKYEIDSIIHALKVENSIVHCEIRNYDADVRVYAEKISTEIDSLVSSGVRPYDITVIGASKGAIIACNISDMNIHDINYIFLAGNNDYQEKHNDWNFHGNILCIYDPSDNIAGKDYSYWKQKENFTSGFEQLEIKTGLGHGFLYKPLPEWVIPAKEWVNNRILPKDTLPHKPGMAVEIDSLLRMPTEKPFNGVVLITQNKEVIYSKVCGYSDFDNKTVLKNNHQFVIGSVSKQFTATIILQEHDKGHLDLHLPIKEYLPDLPGSWADTVTIHHLLTHTHGITALDKETSFAVGSQFAYSQTGYDLLAKIAERTSRKSFVKLSDELFKDCGMYHTFHPELKANNLAKGYIENDKGGLEYTNKSLDEYPAAAGAFISTAEDLMLWNNLFFEGKLFKEDTFRSMTTKQDKAKRNHPLFGITEYGYGITVDNKDGIIQWGQTGYTTGFVSMNYYYPQHKMSVVVLTNVNYDVSEIKKTFYHLIQILGIVRDTLK